MVNNSDFIVRLKKVIQHYQLTASNFADKIEVQRSSISHILSGRNKPSLDFVLKVTSQFPEVDIYWLLKGKGSFPKSNSFTPPTPLISEKESKIFKSISDEKQILRILVFYNDGTFEEYKK